MSSARRGRGQRRRHLHRIQQPVRQRAVAGETPDVNRQQREHRDQVEHALHDHGRDRRRIDEPFRRARRYGRQHIANACRQDRQRGESNHGRAKHRAERRPADRREQMLPADRTGPIRRHDEDERQG